VHGLGFAVYLGFTYTLLGASLLFLATAAAYARGVFRVQIAVLFLFAVVPGVTGLLYVTGNTPVPGLNVPALSLVVSTGAVAVSFARFQWTEMTPIARDRTFESMTEAVMVLNGRKRIIDLNTAAERLLPESEVSWIGEPATEVLPELAEPLESIDSETASVDARTEITIRDGGDRRFLDVRASPVGASIGDPTGYTVLLHDITARKVAQERAEERRQKIEELHRIARHLTAARTRPEVFQRAVNGGREVLDADVCRLSVEDGGDLVPTASSDDEPLDEYDPQPVDHGIAGVTFQSGVPVVVDDLVDTRTDGSASGSDPGPYFAEGASSPADSESTYRALLSAPIGDIGTIQALAAEPGAFSDDDREVLELLTTHIETAVQRADAESELRTERDRLEEFASVVSHDLRNPLNVAQGRIELLKEETSTDHVEPIDRSLSRMEEIITDILTLTREGDAVGDLETIDLGAAIEDAWGTVDTEPATLRRPDNLGTVEADPGQLRQVLENLFHNAVEHGSTESGSAPEGEADDSTDSGVTVRVGRIDEGTGFYVEDDGPGIPPDDRETVFEYGYTTGSDGTGLGLTIVRRIADAHGWTVDVDESDAGGARFEIRTDG
jgi:PAS domain S-box-containing protein